MTTGLLPVREMKLSEAWTERAMENIYLTLFYGPFLTPQSQLQMFLPKAPWLDTDQEEEWKQIKEGWLLLKAGVQEKG